MAPRQASEELQASFEPVQLSLAPEKALQVAAVIAAAATVAAAVTTANATAEAQGAAERGGGESKEVTLGYRIGKGA